MKNPGILAAFILMGTLAAAGASPALAQQPGSGAAGQPQGRTVIVNGERLTDAEIAMATAHKVQVMDGRFWYDRLTGAWGQEGGPCLGFIAAGMKLGGPLKRDASNGHTGVFINNRELHALDVARLQTVIPVIRGRYWATADSTFGYEGGPAIGNIWLAVAARFNQGGGGGGSVRREGILSGYDRTGIAVFGY